MKVIDPSEIILEGGASFQKENVTRVNPWIRCIGRFFDYSLFCLFLLFFRKFFVVDHAQYWIPFEYFIWIPIEAVLLSTWGTTPGKFFLKTQLKAGKRKKLDFVAALRRSFSVWFRGMGMGIPLFNFFCLLIAYNKLKVLQITSWDRDDHIQVTHYPIGRWRIYTATLIAVVGMLYYSVAAKSL